MGTLCIVGLQHPSGTAIAADGPFTAAPSISAWPTSPEADCGSRVNSAHFACDSDMLTLISPFRSALTVRVSFQYFHKTFSLYERLFDLLASDATFMLQPEKLRHPLIFYFGHTAVFFINKLRLAGLLQGRINEALESTLAIGVDEMSWDDLNSANYVWPSVAQVRAYRDVARVVVDDLISTLPLQLPITWESPFWVILLVSVAPAQSPSFAVAAAVSIAHLLADLAAH